MTSMSDIFSTSNLSNGSTKSEPKSKKEKCIFPELIGHYEIIRKVGSGKFKKKTILNN